MGSGKSVIGRDLSQILNMRFIDTDLEIEKEIGKSINDIFRNHGEVFFRKIEKKICLKALNNKDTIISLGGGSILNSSVRNSIKINSYSIFLKVDVDIILKRLINSKKRPLLNNGNKEEILKNLYKERIQYFNNTDLVIYNNTNKKELLGKIINELQKI